MVCHIYVDPYCRHWGHVVMSNEKEVTLIYMSYHQATQIMPRIGKL